MSKTILMDTLENEINLEIIKKKVIDYNAYIDDKDKNHNNCLHIACIADQGLDVIQYLIEDCYANKCDTKCIFLACSRNTHLDVIYYLTQKIGTHYVDNFNNSCLTIATSYNPNVEITKFLVEKMNMNVNHENNNGDNCFVCACNYNNNFVAKYLIENYNVKINISKISYVAYERILLLIDKYTIFNKFLIEGLKHYTAFFQIFEKINPILFNFSNSFIRSKIKSYAHIPDIFKNNVKYDKYIKHVDRLVSPIDIRYKL